MPRAQTENHPHEGIQTFPPASSYPKVVCWMSQQASAIQAKTAQVWHGRTNQVSGVQQPSR